MGLSVAASAAVSVLIGLAAFYVLRGLNAEFERSEKIAQVADKTHALQVLTAAFREESARSDVRQVLLATPANSSPPRGRCAPQADTQRLATRSSSPRNCRRI